MDSHILRRQARNRRLNWLILSVVSAVGTVGCCIGLALEYNRRNHQTDEIVETSAADLLENGPGKAIHFRITGLQIAREYYQEGGPEGAIGVWLPAAPAADPPLARVPPNATSRVLFLRIRGKARDDVVGKLEAEGTFVGRLDHPTGRWNQGAKLYFRRCYPDVDLDTKMILREYEPGPVDAIWYLRIGFVIGLLATVLCATVFFRLRHSVAPKPPPLPWE